MNNSSNKEYKLANVNNKEEEVIKRAEQMVKSETGKEYIMIAWEKNRLN